jgi:hypothetical protein
MNIQQGASLWSTKNNQWIQATPQSPNDDRFPLNGTWTWEGRLNGSYQFPHGLQASTLLRAQSGIPGQRTFIFTSRVVQVMAGLHPEWLPASWSRTPARSGRRRSLTGSRSAYNRNGPRTPVGRRRTSFSLRRKKQNVNVSDEILRACVKSAVKRRADGCFVWKRDPQNVFDPLSEFARGASDCTKLHHASQETGTQSARNGAGRRRTARSLTRSPRSVTTDRICRGLGGGCSIR